MPVTSDASALEQGFQAFLIRAIFIIVLLAMAAVIVFLSYRLSRRAGDMVARMILRARPAEASLSFLLSRLVRIGVVMMAAAVSLAILGVDVGALVTGLGLGTVAVGFALKDTIEQAITGVLLILLRPFQVGDIISLDVYEGTVVQIDIRTTSIRTYDGLLVLIPNNKVYQGIITNKTYYPTRRLTLTVGVTYGADLVTTHRAIYDSLLQTPCVLADPAPLVSFESFDDRTVRTVVQFWIEPAKSNLLDAQTAVMQAVMAVSRRDQIGVAQVQAPIGARS